MVVPMVPGAGRPSPPAELDALERRTWKDVVDALPVHWIDPAGCIVLCRLVAQAAISERQEARLRMLREQDRDLARTPRRLRPATASPPRSSRSC
jgi:hypothetical protein